jgi:SAM-dependent methyltransferase
MTKSTSTVGAHDYIHSGDASARDLHNLRTVNRDASHVVPHLRPGMRVVDFGCGAGSVTCGFAELVAPAEVLGFDISEEAIARARSLAAQSGLTNVQFSVSNIYDLDLPADSFDVAHFSAVLMHLKEPEHALQLAFRCLKSADCWPLAKPRKQVIGSAVRARRPLHFSTASLSRSTRPPVATRTWESGSLASPARWVSRALRRGPATRPRCQMCAPLPP